MNPDRQTDSSVKSSQFPALIVHGGAWEIPPEAVEECKEGCRKALEAGWGILLGGGPAVDAVEAAIEVLEDHPVFDAGTGSHLNVEGRVELDAILMDGRTLNAGAVASVQRVKNPIRLARKILDSCEHLMLVGVGAEQFAAEQGMQLCRPEELVVEREVQAWEKCSRRGHAAVHHSFSAQGTVGAVAVDCAGGLAAGTSTGGTCCKLPGRVGDSPLIGSGCYADVEAGGVSCTGWGEAIMKIVMAKTACDLLRPLTGGVSLAPMEAARECVHLLSKRAGGSGGLVLLDRNGRIGFAFNTPNLARGYVREDGRFVTEV